jgi:hypothetical protein
MPELVRWRRVPGGWGSRPLKQIHRSRISPKGSTSAKLCADETFALAKLAAGLFREYEDLRKALEYVLRQLSRMNARYARVNEAEAQILWHYGAAMDKLDAAGYAVDPAKRTMPDQWLDR